MADQPKKAAKMIAELRDEQLKSIEEKRWHSCES